MMRVNAMSKLMGSNPGAIAKPEMWGRKLLPFAAAILLVVSVTGHAQEVRYSWFEVSYVQQDLSKAGSLTDIAVNQTVDISTSDGNGIRFRGSLGTWNNFFTFLDFNSSDIDVDATVVNDQGEFSASDQFDYTGIRGGIGLKWSVRFGTDLFGAVTYDSADLDFGSFAGENFDASDKGLGATAGVRSIFADKIELRAHARYTEVGDIDLSTVSSAPILSTVSDSASSSCAVSR
jgi:hypothetical protein